MSLFQRMGGTSTTTNGKFSLEAFEEEAIAAAQGDTNTTELSDAAAQGEQDIVEAATDAVEVSNDVDVMQEAMFALEDGEEIAEVQDQVENATQADIDNAAALQQTVMERVEGKGNVEDVPATESTVGGRISTEGFKEWIKAAWEKIKEFASNIYNKIKMIWKKFVNGTGRLLKRVEALKEKLKNKKDKLKDEAKIKLNLPVLALTSSGKFDPKVAYGQLATFVKECDAISANPKDALKELKKVVDECKAEAAKDTDEAGYMSFLKEQAEGLLDYVEHSKEFTLDKRFGKLKVIYAPSDLGNKAIFTCVDKDAQSLTTVFNSVSYRFENLHRNWNTATKDNEHPALTKAQCQDIANSIEKAAKSLQNFFEKDTFSFEKDISGIKEAIEKAIKESKENVSAYGKEIFKGLQRVYVIPTQLLRMSMNISSFYVQQAGAFLTLADVSADKLEDDKKD